MVTYKYVGGGGGVLNHHHRPFPGSANRKVDTKPSVRSRLFHTLL